jgi:hypothetical protein
VHLKSTVYYKTNKVPSKRQKLCSREGQRMSACEETPKCWRALYGFSAVCKIPFIFVKEPSNFKSLDLQGALVCYRSLAWDEPSSSRLKIS